MKFKKFFVYLLFLVPWFISALIFKSDSSYYYSLNLPWFAPPPIIFAIVWPILYTLIAYSIYKVLPNSSSNYKKVRQKNKQLFKNPIHYHKTSQIKIEYYFT